PGSRVVAVYVGEYAAGELYVEIAPAVAVRCSPDEDGDVISVMLFHRDGYGVGTCSELASRERHEVSDTLNAPWPPDEDAKRLESEIANMKSHWRWCAKAREERKAAAANGKEVAP